jgi:UDP-N-acetylmuramoyl-L-alanyl-D-glutamate--2,6-diaminopimelate ligase
MTSADVPGRTGQALIERLRARGFLRVVHASETPAALTAPLGEVELEPARVTPGSIFANLHGPARSPEIIARAAAAGAGIILTQTPLAVAVPVPVVEVTSIRRALSCAAAWWHGDPAAELCVIGVTGTNGKSTTCAMISRCFDAAALPHALLCSEAQRIGDTIEKPILTTPDAPVQHRQLRRAVNLGCRHAVLEVSSQGIAQERVAGIPFRIGVLTSFAPDHTDFHPDMDHYARTKRRLFEDLPPDGWALYAAAIPRGREIVAGARCPVLSVGRGEDADLRIEGARVIFGERWARRTEREPWTLHLDWDPRETHQIGNAALAAASARLAGVSWPAIARALADCPRLPCRTEELHRGRFLAMHDKGFNPESVMPACAWVEAQARYRRGTVLVMAPRGNRGEVINRLTSEAWRDAAARLRLRTIIVSQSEDVTGAPDRLTEAELQATIEPLASLSRPLVVERTLEAALYRGLREVRRGEILLLVGAQGMDPATEVLGGILDREARRWFPRWRRADWALVDPMTAVERMLRMSPDKIA